MIPGYPKPFGLPALKLIIKTIQIFSNTKNKNTKKIKAYGAKPKRGLVKLFTRALSHWQKKQIPRAKICLYTLIY